MDLNDKELLEFIEQFNREHSGELPEETAPRNEDVATFTPVACSQVCILYRLSIYKRQTNTAKGPKSTVLIQNTKYNLIK